MNQQTRAILDRLTAKTYCRQLRCTRCGTPLTHKLRGPSRQFCNSGCASAYRRGRKAYSKLWIDAIQSGQPEPESDYGVEDFSHGQFILSDDGQTLEPAPTKAERAQLWIDFDFARAEDFWGKGATESHILHFEAKVASGCWEPDGALTLGSFLKSKRDYRREMGSEWVDNVMSLWRNGDTFEYDSGGPRRVRLEIRNDG